MARHEKTCTGQNIKREYIGGVYQPAETIFETLHRYGLSHIDPNYVYPYRATFDFEVFFDHSNLPQQKTNDTEYTARHVPLSVSVASNVPRFDQARCFVSDGDSQKLIDDMVDYLEEISNHAYLLLTETFQPLYDALEQLEKEVNTFVPVKRLKEKLDEYLQELPVIGFNSAKYDINVIKPYLMERFVSSTAPEEKEEEEEEEETIDKDADAQAANNSPFKFIVKRNNSFMCISTKTLKFLDIVNYLAPGFSYAKYLAAYDVDESKGFFPYEYMTSLSQLKETSLPPHSAFYSSLKKSNITEEEYAFCEKVWTDQNMTTFEDFLVWYNNLDVAPFLLALQKQADFYSTLGVDIFKQAISVPGVTLRYLFKSIPRDTYFSLFNEKQKDVHQLLRDNLTGGPSIIFHRYHEKNQTFVRNNPEKKVQSVEGFDANALYLYALMQPMPTEHPIIRRKQSGFKAEMTDPYGQQAREWLTYIEQSTQSQLQHKFNGKEMQLGPKRLRVDGWDSKARVAYQFHGCLFHGHDDPNCPITRDLSINPVNNKPLTELRDKTRQLTDYLRDEVGVKVVAIWECQWKKENRENRSLQTFLHKRFPLSSHRPLKQLNPTQQNIIDAVLDGTLFGLVQCDLHVPDRLKEYFSEMTPIFKNTQISKEDIGPHMREYAEQHKLLSTSRRTLIGSFVGEKILLATPLLRWYLQKGLEITDVYLVVEYKPDACFQKFGNDVSAARRTGDADSSKTILGETYKLLGNSAYGKTITNLDKQYKVVYVESDQVPKHVNSKHFRKLTHLNKSLYEIELTKTKIKYQLPLQIGFFV
mgnify:FL=1